MKIICDFSVFYLDETLPKGSIVVECGNALLKNGYKLKILNTINFSKSMHYNPFSYVHSEKDILKLVTTLMTNTKGDGSGGDPFWEKSERLLLTALIAYLHYEAPKEEQKYLEKGERTKRTHRLCNLGGTIESLAPEVKDLTRTEMTELMEQIFSLSEVQRAVRHMTITHISQANREKELRADGTISSERHAD